MRIFVCHDWYPDVYQAFTWHDGLAAAIRELSKRHEVLFVTCTKGDPFILPHDYFPIHFVKSGEGMVDKAREFRPDVILHWADTTRENAQPLAELGIPMALCFAGGAPNGRTLPYFDHIFVESQVYKEAFEVLGVSVSTAFGTNTELFQPIPDQQKYFDVIFPATYCDWKRHKLFSEATKGLQVVTAGFMYSVQERYCWEETMKGGALTLPHVSAKTLQHLYAASRLCVVTSRASGGSQRTVLEAMSMNIPVITMMDSDKTSEFVQDAMDMRLPAGLLSEASAEAIRGTIERALHHDDFACKGREYVLSKWSEHHYADALEEGLKKILR